MSGKYQGIIHFYFYKITGEQMVSLFESRRRYYEHDRPIYIFRENNKNIDYVNSYYQFIQPDDKEYIVFDCDSADKILSEEISQVGLVDLLAYSDSILVDGNNPNILLNRWDSRDIPKPTLFKMTIEYWGDGVWEDYDSLTSFEIVLRKKKEEE